MFIIGTHRTGILLGLLVLLVWCFQGCGQPEPIVGLEQPEPPPTRLVEGPGFTIEIPEEWSSKIDGSKLVITAPPKDCSVLFVVEVEPYQSGETSENILLEAERSRSKLKNANHTHNQLDGVPYYRCLYARKPKESAFDSGLYLMAHPGKKVTGTMEWGSMKDVIPSIVRIELAMKSISFK